MVDDLKKGYYLLFIDGGKRANEQGQAEGAIGVILQEPDCGAVDEEVQEALKPFKAWQLSWVPREMNIDADKLVDQAFKGEPVTHATD